MLEQLYILPILLFSVVIHELSHGYMALRLGDPTAKQMGRLTFNPIPHIDPVGSILVPLASLLIAGRVFIAWAKPVPVNPLNFANMRRDDILVAVVGPLSNILMALCCALIAVGLSLLSGMLGVVLSPVLDDFFSFLFKMFYGGVYLNIVLAVFNLIPIPPSDGSHVVASLLPAQAADQYRRVGFFGIFLILILMRTEPFRLVFSFIIETLAYPLRILIHAFV
jgi:Zn-dependent protease